MIRVRCVPALRAIAMVVAAATVGHAQTFVDTGVSLPGVTEPALAWGDYDGDSDLDLALAGQTASGPIARIYRNDGGTLVDSGIALPPGLQYAALAWCDYDLDGDLDLFVAGTGGGTKVALVLRNDGGRFVDSGLALTGVTYDATAAWGDVDNDGRPDLAFSGQAIFENVFGLYRNGASGFSELRTGIPGVQTGRIALGDVDGDGRLDVALAGPPHHSSYITIARVYLNRGSGTFVDLEANLPSGASCRLAFCDFDGDGDLDLVLSGSSTTHEFTRLYRNDEGRLVDILSLPASDSGELLWGDVDNDGVPDLLVVASNGGAAATQLYLGRSGSLSAQASSLVGVAHGTAAFGDFDGDGDLDVVVAGRDAGGTAVTRLYRNDVAQRNTAPSAPSSLSATTSGDRVDFRWAATSDAESPAAGLSYAIRVGRSPGSADVVRPPAAASGARRVAERAPIQGTRWSLRGLAPGTYYWSVQAVDPGFAGSAWSAEASVTIAPASSLAVTEPIERDAWGWGVAHRVAWTAQGVTGDVLVELSSDDGATFTTLGQAPATAGSLSLTTPQVTGDRCRVRVRQVGGTIADTSPRFSIAARALRVLAPPTDEVWQLTRPQTVRWRAENVVGDVQVDLSRDGGQTWTAVGAAPASAGSFTWTPGGAPARGCRVRLSESQGLTDLSGRLCLTHWPFRRAAFLTGVQHGGVGWADVNDDGKLDLAALGSSANGNRLHVYHGDGAGGFNLVQDVRGNDSGGLAWVDEDNDGDPDLWITGGNNQGTRLYRNTAGVLSDVLQLPIAYQVGRVVPADFDRDGRVDLLLGPVRPPEVTTLYRNTRSGYQDTGQSFAQIIDGNAAWLDADGDGLLDLVATGANRIGPEHTTLYRQSAGGAFAPVTSAGLPAAFQSYVSVADFDGDGDPDLVLLGHNRTPNFTRAYRNDGNGVFTDIGAVLPELHTGSMAWADFDNDGDLDLAIMGMLDGGATVLTVLRNDGGNVFTDIVLPIEPFYRGQLAWGDYDGDGDLDLVAAGLTSFGATTLVLRNDGDRFNAPPSPPGRPTVRVDGTQVRFSWTAGSDAETPPPLLTYSLRVGSAPGLQDVLSAAADLTTGRRRIIQPGNVGARLDHILVDLAPGTYWCQVQTVDGAFAGSTWSPAVSFKVPVEVELASAAQTCSETSGAVVVELRLSSESARDVTVPFTVSGTATAGVDHDLAPGVATIAAGTVSTTLRITLFDDALIEGAETIVVQIGAPTGAALGARTQHTVRIADDDAPPPTVEVATIAQTTTETIGGASIELRLSLAAAEDVVLPYSVAGTASIGTDHDLWPGVVTIPAGSTSVLLQFNLLDDAVHEGSETVVVVLGTPTGGGATLGPQAQHTLTIADDDPAAAPTPSPPAQPVAPAPAPPPAAQPPPPSPPALPSTASATSPPSGGSSGGGGGCHLGGAQRATDSGALALPLLLALLLIVRRPRARTRRPAAQARDALAEERSRLLLLPAMPFPCDERREGAVGETPFRERVQRLGLHGVLARWESQL